MRILISQAIQHSIDSDRVAIYSVDVQGSGERLATCGSDGCVRIWSEALWKEELRQPSKPLLLSTLRSHSAPVHTVRWSERGWCLASCSDDRTAIIWRRSPTPSLTNSLASFSSARIRLPVPGDSEAAGAMAEDGDSKSQDEEDVEFWKPILVLQRHTAEVHDVAWSPDDRFAVTACIDNSLNLWRVDAATAQKPAFTSWHNGVPRSEQSPLATWKAHNNWVRGVAWDPLGKFIASAGDDHRVKLWHVGDIADMVSSHSGAGATIPPPKLVAEDHKSYEPPEGILEQPPARRLDWSPDGQILATTGGWKEGRHVVPMWSGKSVGAYCAGHASTVSATRFSKCLAIAPNEEGAEEGEEEGGQKEETFNSCSLLLAVGSVDGALSLWSNKTVKPLVVLKRVFDGPISDLTWVPNTSVLVACSLDGTVACIEALESEVGRVITRKKTVKMIADNFGAWQLLGQSTGPDLDYGFDKTEVQDRNLEERMSTPPALRQITWQETRAMQKESKETGGKGRRRIMPVLLSAPLEAEGSATPSKRQRIALSPVPAAPAVASTPVSSLAAESQNDRLAALGRRLGDDSLVAPPQVVAFKPVIDPLRLFKPHFDAADDRKHSIPIQWNPGFAEPADAAGEVLEQTQALRTRDDTVFYRVLGRAKRAIASAELEVQRQILGFHSGMAMWKKRFDSPITAAHSCGALTLAGCADGSLHILGRDGDYLLPKQLLCAPVAFLHSTLVRCRNLPVSLQQQEEASSNGAAVFLGALLIDGSTRSWLLRGAPLSLGFVSEEGLPATGPQLYSLVSVSRDHVGNAIKSNVEKLKVHSFTVTGRGEPMLTVHEKVDETEADDKMFEFDFGVPESFLDLTMEEEVDKGEEEEEIEKGDSDSKEDKGAEEAKEASEQQANSSSGPTATAAGATVEEGNPRPSTGAASKGTLTPPPPSSQGEAKNGDGEAMAALPAPAPNGESSKDIAAAEEAAANADGHSNTGAIDPPMPDAPKAPSPSRPTTAAETSAPQPTTEDTAMTEAEPPEPPSAFNTAEGLAALSSVTFGWKERQFRYSLESQTWEEMPIFTSLSELIFDVLADTAAAETADAPRLTARPRNLPGADKRLNPSQASALSAAANSVNALASSDAEDGKSRDENTVTKASAAAGEGMLVGSLWMALYTKDLPRIMQLANELGWLFGETKNSQAIRGILNAAKEQIKGEDAEKILQCLATGFENALAKFPSVLNEVSAVFPRDSFQ